MEIPGKNFFEFTEIGELLMILEDKKNNQFLIDKKGQKTQTLKLMNPLFISELPQISLVCQEDLTFKFFKVKKGKYLKLEKEIAHDFGEDILFSFSRNKILNERMEDLEELDTEFFPNYLYSFNKKF